MYDFCDLTGKHGVTVEEIELEALVLRAKAGDPEAQTALLREYRAFLKRTAHFARKKAGLTGSMATTNVVVQETSLKVLEKLQKHEWKGERYFVRWLQLLTQGTASDLAKAENAAKRGGKGRETNSSPADTCILLGVDPRSTEDLKDRLATIEKAAKAHLELDQSRVILLQLQGWDNEDISEVMEKTPDAVRKLTERAVKKLSAVLVHPSEGQGVFEYQEWLDGAEEREVSRELKEAEIELARLKNS